MIFPGRFVVSAKQIVGDNGFVLSVSILKPDILTKPCSDNFC